MKIILLSFLIFLYFIFPYNLLAQDSLNNKEKIIISDPEISKIVDISDTLTYKPAAVYLFRDTLFLIKIPQGTISTTQRAENISKKLTDISKIFDRSSDTIYLKHGNDFINIMHNDEMAYMLTSADAKSHNTSLTKLANDQLTVLRERLDTKTTDLTLKEMLILAGYFLISALGLFILLKLIQWVFKLIISRLSKFEKSILNNKKNLIKYFIPRNTKNIFVFVAKVVRFVIIIMLLLVYLPFMFSFFPATEGIVGLFYGYILTPIKFLFFGFIDFLPSLFFILVILIFTRYVIKVSKYFVEDVENEKLILKGFPKDWANTTQKMFSVLVYAFSIVLIYPHIPGSSSDAFKGVTIFIGALVSFGSTSAIANIVAGIVITYMRPYQIGDRVLIQGTYGDVIERSLLVTRIHTLKNEEVTIPNANIIGSHILNYTANSKKTGVILHTSITLGYDVPWNLAEKLLLKAARKSILLQKEPKPFVLQTSLDNNYVSYELNAYSKQEKKMPLIYSDIHRNILDVFNEAGVEILSPAYVSARDGNLTTVPGLIKPNTKTPIEKIVDHFTGRNQKITIEKSDEEKSND
jgi:small-conductance mechanosensitive channel